MTNAPRTHRGRGTPPEIFHLVILCGLSLIATVPPALDAQVTRDPRASSEAASDTVDLGPLTGRPRISPSRTSIPPVIDGRLDDEVWRTATKITELVQQSPLDGAPATEATDIYIAYDSDQIYFGFHVHYEDPSIMRANRVDRDRAQADDLMTIYLDPFMDQQQGFDFDVNAYGVQGDGIISRTGGGARSDSLCGPFMGCPVRDRRPDRGGWFYG